MQSHNLRTEYMMSHHVPQKLLQQHPLDFSLKALHLADIIKLVPSRLAKPLLAAVISIVIRLFLYWPQCQFHQASDYLDINSKVQRD
jgi:hypothetical protein